MLLFNYDLNYGNVTRLQRHSTIMCINYNLQFISTYTCWIEEVVSFKIDNLYNMINSRNSSEEGANTTTNKF